MNSAKEVLLKLFLMIVIMVIGRVIISNFYSTVSPPQPQMEAIATVGYIGIVFLFFATLIYREVKST